MKANRSRQTGAALITALFLLLLFAGLAAAMLNLGTAQQAALAQDVRGARALQAARAGLEWGFYQVLDPAHASVVPPSDPSWPHLPDCPPATDLDVDGFKVSVSCSRSPTGNPGYYEEAGNRRRLRVFTLIATASAGTLGTTSYVERRLRAEIAKCRDAAGNALRGYDCL